MLSFLTPISERSQETYLMSAKILPLFEVNIVLIIEKLDMRALCHIFLCWFYLPPSFPFSSRSLSHQKVYIKPFTHPDQTTCPSPVCPAIHRSHECHEPRPKSSKTPSPSFHFMFFTMLHTYLQLLSPCPPFWTVGFSYIFDMACSRQFPWFCYWLIVYLCSGVLWYVYLISLLCSCSSCFY